MLSFNWDEKDKPSLQPKMKRLHMKREDIIRMALEKRYIILRGLDESSPAS